METANRAEGLPKQFGTVRALDGLDLEVRAGEVFEYLGPNSAGKATTIRLLLLGMLRPTPAGPRSSAWTRSGTPWRRTKGEGPPALPAEVPTPRGYPQRMLAAHVAGGS